MKKEVKGFGGNYLVYDNGKVFSKFSNRFLKPSKTCGGYEQITLSYRGDQAHIMVHRLVAEYFCEGFSPELHVNHKDAIRDNNRSSNLEWITPHENIKDTIYRGTHVSVNNKMKEAREKLDNKKKVDKLDLNGNFICRYNSVKQAGEHNSICKTAIGAACRGIYKTSGGFKWEFSKD